jgi:hypothetical protein
VDSTEPPADTEPEAETAPPPDPPPPDAPADVARPSWRALALGVVVAVVAAFVLLLVAGSIGTAGLVIVAAVEAMLVYLLYRWSPSR